MAIAGENSIHRDGRNGLPPSSLQVATSASLEYEWCIFMLITASQRRLPFGLLAASFFAFLGPMMLLAQQLDTASVIHQVDAAVKARNENLAGYSATEHYAVYRNKDEIHPVAEMTVMTNYRRDSGKSYTIVSQTGSSVIRDLILGGILDNEKQLSQPGIREGVWITSANYEMNLKPGGTNC